MANIVWTFGSYSFANEGNPEGPFDWTNLIRLGETIIPQKHGSVVSTPFKDPLTFSIRGSLGDLTAQGLRTKLELLTDVINGGRQQLKIWDDRYINVTAVDFQWEYLAGGAMLYLSFHIVFRADDPFWEAVSASTGNFTTNNPAAIVSNTGNASAWPTFTITAPAGGMTAVVLKNITNNKTFSWAGSLTVGQLLVVNMKSQSITEVGIDKLTGFSGEFWSLLPGSNTLDLSSTSIGATVAVSWRDSWD